MRLRSVTLDTDTTVHTLFGQAMGARKAYNPQHKGKKSYQPLLTFCAERRECLRGELHNGDRPSGAPIARHREGAFSALPEGVKILYARADWGFYCWEAVQAYERHCCPFIVSARKTARLVDALKAAEWKALAGHGWGGPMRVSLPAEGREQGLWLCGAALRERQEVRARAG